MIKRKNGEKLYIAGKNNIQITKKFSSENIKARQLTNFSFKVLK
jgi:hypothetical protein